jgi:hypothetical protein
MSEPSRALLLTAHKRNPLVTAPAQSLPHVRVPIHASSLLRLLERTPRRRADPMRETLVVPECAVLQHEPAARLADSAPAFALVAVPAHPPWRVEVAVEAELLLVGKQVWVRRVHVFGRWRDVLFVERGVEVWRVGEVGVVRVEGVRVCVALEHAEEAVGEEGWWGFELVWFVEGVGGEEHRVAVEAGVV